MYFLINRGISLITLLPMGGGVRGELVVGLFPPPPSGREGVGLLIFSLSPTSLGLVYSPY